jgi:hypothetical protein
MASARDSVEVLDACLKAIERGEATIDECVARYPDVDGLREMLHAAAGARAMPRPVMSATARNVLEQRLRRRMAESGPRRSFRSWLRVPMTLAATALLALAIGVGLARVSDSAVPGDALYGVKRASEQVSLLFSGGAARPAALAHIAEARLSELAILASRGQAIDQALRDATSSLNDAAAAQPDPATRATLYLQGIQAVARATTSGRPVQPSTLAALLAALRGIATPTSTPTSTALPTRTATLTASWTVTPTLTPSVTSTLTASVAPSVAATDTLAITPTPAPTATPSPSATRYVAPTSVATEQPPTAAPPTPTVEHGGDTRETPDGTDGKKTPEGTDGRSGGSNDD